MKALLEQNVIQIILKKLEYEISTTLPDHYFQDMTLDSYTDFKARELILHLKTFLYGQKSEEKEYISIPINWFQSFKEQYFPKFLLKKYPIIKKKITIRYEITKICPHINKTSKRDHLKFFITK